MIYLLLFCSLSEGNNLTWWSDEGKTNQIRNVEDKIKLRAVEHSRADFGFRYRWVVQFTSCFCGFLRNTELYYSLAAEVFWCLKALCQFLKLRSVRLLMSPLFIFSPQCFFPERQFDWQLTSGWRTAAHWINTILQSARLRQWRPADDWMSSCSWRRVEVVEGVCGVHPAVLRG